jgi:hypothetical protein
VLRRAADLPVYTVALVLDLLTDALGRLAAWIAGDDWPWSDASPCSRNKVLFVFEPQCPKR